MSNSNEGSRNSSRKAALGFLLGLGMVVGVAPLTLAQTSAQPANPLQDLQTQDSSDPFSNRGNGQMNGIFDIVHRAMQGGRSLDEFSSEQKESLDDATAQFRAKQRQQLQSGGSQSATTTPGATTPNLVISPAPATP